MDNYDRVKKVFEGFGYTTLEKPEMNENGVDMYVVGNKKSLKIEIKSVRVVSSGSWQTPPIEPGQRSSDMVAAVFKSGYVFIEKTEDFLSHCGKGGIRTFTNFKL